MFGHPLHPALVHFPIGLLLSATLADVAWLAGLTTDTHAGAVMMAGGLVMALVAMGAGLLDFTRLEESVVPHALRHMAAVGVAWQIIIVMIVCFLKLFIPLRCPGRPLLVFPGLTVFA